MQEDDQKLHGKKAKRRVLINVHGIHLAAISRANRSRPSKPLPLPRQYPMGMTSVIIPIRPSAVRIYLFEMRRREDERPNQASLRNGEEHSRLTITA